MAAVKETVALKNGIEIPAIGYGTWLVNDAKTAAATVAEAVKAGYRHIDTAAYYGNEASVAEGIRMSGIPREKLFVTSKVWYTDRGYEKTMAAFERTMDAFSFDYLDLYLVHWPAVPKNYDNWKELNAETWRAMEAIYRSGRVRAIGVSNFLPHHLEPLLETAEIIPMVNQIEFRPGYAQIECADWCNGRGIVPEAWRPLGAGAALKGEVLTELSKKYQKSPAQICIRWVLQHGLIPLPKSANPVRMRENLRVFDFELSAEDMLKIDALPLDEESALPPDRLVEK